MPSWRTMRLKVAFVFICIVLTSPMLFSAATKIILVGDSIPERYSIYPYKIYNNSDTLILNQRRLQRSVDYHFESNRGRFDLSALQVNRNDTLTMIYHTIPSWLTSPFGRPIPSSESANQHVRIQTDYKLSAELTRRSSSLQFSGAKSFRFSSRSQGNSEFGQTLDLTLSGELTPGLTLTGAISDRGYEPTYGVANSRLSELEKVQLSLSSKRFHARLGDFATGGIGQADVRRKRVSGAEFVIKNRSYHIDGLIARPKGTFASAQFVGVDQRQGPYQITGAGNPIVPGSETVWIDGVRLERGGNKDYILDYPVGRITFTEKQAIDKRSRIEVDYELQTSAYRGELFSGSTSAFTSDSSMTFTFGWVREGDDRSQPLIGDLSQADIDLLSIVGDSVDLATRSAVVLDTLGSYRIVLDSLPDSVYIFIGEGSGDFSIGFRFVGAGRGDYRFIGNGVYQFEGVNGGDYLPERKIVAPERIDQYHALFSMTNKTFGRFTTELKQSVLDRNLLSMRDDGNNSGGLYRAEYRRALGESERGGHVYLSARLRQDEFASRSRINQADFGRQYFLPLGFVGNSDETIYRADLSLPLPGRVMLSPSVDRLSYADELSLVRSKLQLDIPMLSNLQMQLSGHVIKTKIDSSQTDQEGTQKRFQAALRWQANGKTNAVISAENDRRVHDYTGSEKGTRYNLVRAELNRSTEQIAIEQYVEDSLTSDWSQTLKRTRLSFLSSHRKGGFAYTSSVSQQWLSSQAGNDRNFMGRLTWSFRRATSRLTINSSYSLSRENRNARGVSYLKVEPGEGEFIFEDSQYIPDVDGDFIQVDELLSEMQSVDRGSKTFSLSKTWKDVSVNFNSRIEEELLEEGDRGAIWVLPFWSDESEAYLFFNRSSQSEVRLWPVATSYAINMKLRENKEIRKVTGQDRVKRARVGTLTLRQAPGLYRIEQEFELFANDRNAYFTGGGEIDGLSVSGALRRLIGRSDVRMRIGYRHASSSNNEESDQVSVTFEGRLAIVKQGILQPKIELYRQTLTSIESTTSFLLTDNRPGVRGVIWSVAARIGLKKQMRLNMTVSGRHSDNRTGRILGRGEVVAMF